MKKEGKIRKKRKKRGKKSKIVLTNFKQTNKQRAKRITKTDRHTLFKRRDGSPEKKIRIFKACLMPPKMLRCPRRRRPFSTNESVKCKCNFEIDFMSTSIILVREAGIRQMAIRRGSCLLMPRFVEVARLLMIYSYRVFRIH